MKVLDLNIKRLISLLFLFTFFCSSVFAQDKNDEVTMLNGDVKKGKVTSISTETIKFKYEGEDLEYEIAKKEISQIKFSSGRVEAFTTVKQQVKAIASRSNSGSSKNSIAILPFAIVSNDDTIQPDVFSVQVQNDCANVLREEAIHGVKVQDAMTTNALLSKNNLDASNISTKLPAELANLLGVEFVLYGGAEVINEGTTSYGSGSTVYKEKDTNKDRNKKESKGTSYSSSSTTTTVTYDVKLDLKIFNDQGENIYAETRHPFGLGGIEAYHSGLKYMLKRSPFGVKYKK
ncbi:hypothetical protein [Joostella sp.]|uniref:hypothetical protein n=1 Tax=Joostella sp. TaxID=2231138 RepID=UPI003A94F943